MNCQAPKLLRCLVWEVKKKNQLVEKLVTVNCNTGVLGQAVTEGAVIKFEVK